MVAVRARLCDVMLSTKGKRIEATETVRISVPGAATEDGTAKRFSVDVSAEGKRELEKMQKAAQQAAVAAYASIVALSDVTPDDAATIKKPKKKSGDAPSDSADGGSNESAPTSGGGDAGQPQPPTHTG